MIKYKCAFCGSNLETEDSLSGKQELCPVCRKLNAVPLSAEDRTKYDRLQKEKLRQEREQRAQQKGAEDRLANERMDRARKQLSEAVRENEHPVRPSATEKALGVMGSLYVGAGMVAGVICIILGVAFSAVSETRWAMLVAIPAGAAAVASGFLLGIGFFAVELVLQYLRRIMNAVEEGEHASP